MYLFLDSSNITEYTTEGILVREINLKLGWVKNGLRHAVRLNDELIAICLANDDLCHVCTIDSDGHMMKEFYDLKRMIFPIYMIACDSGYMIVADREGNRLVSLNGSLKNVNPELSDSFKLNGPCQACLSGDGKQMFVVDSDGGRLLAIGHMF